MSYKISIIIPVLNEASNIGKLLEHLISNSNLENISEIIIVDGGSTDDSQKIVKAFSDFNHTKNAEAFHYIKNISLEKNQTSQEISKIKISLINSEKGRAKQMNLGAKSSRGNILYFLHADTLPPKQFDKYIIEEVKKKNKAGCFRMQFESEHWWLRLASWLTQFSWRACRGGDQSQFITKDLFNNIGGFDEQYIIYEDNILINKLYAIKEFVVINKKIKTSARLYETYGVWKLQYLYWRIYIKKWMGADAASLYAFYKSKIT
jgi:rSAM/selenodomain-associated transferase 2